MGNSMRKTRTIILLVLAATAFVGCKKGGGGYIQTAPSPVSTAR
jgi:hypothetical protein